MTEAPTVDSDLVTVALRQNAIFIPDAVRTSTPESDVKQSTLTLAVEIAGLGFGLDESLFVAINSAHDDFKADLLFRVRTIMGMSKNWTPLVKDWSVPTGETLFDYFSTYVASILKTKGTALPCGHIIPDGSFPLERYNGCPFCKTPFEFGEIENTGQGSKLRVLALWSGDDLRSFFRDLLRSRTPLDGTQADSLKCLARELSLPSPVVIAMKETMVMVVDSLVAHGKDEEAGGCLQSPTDVLRYLWYKKTGFAQLVEPKTVIAKQLYNREHQYLQKPRNQEQRKEELTNNLKLKYSRSEGRRVAKWINSLPMDIQSMAESMHPNRGMWVRFIRALRLVEFSKRPEFDKLKQLLHAFHKSSYEVWQGKVNSHRLDRDMRSRAGSGLNIPGSSAEQSSSSEMIITARSASGLKKPAF